ncbi:hypothetical protein RND71_023116 [Anisodus tanguticus]|uniref:Uncharacterized protein n=1 Tax=Anisodus tanguticus TaxID=243964 RepID=A0AAE1VBA7_9SOLA|nr:hypothetical protein RND71_023116 [Anisodus tanguticus]
MSIYATAFALSVRGLRLFHRCCLDATVLDKPRDADRLFRTNRVDVAKLIVACLDGAFQLAKSLEVNLIPLEKLEKLDYLGCFLMVTAKWCVEHEKMKDLFILAEDVAYTDACTAITFPKSASKSQHPGCFLKFSELLERINPVIEPELMHLYISVLKASYSSGSNNPTTGDSLPCLSDDVYVAWKFTGFVRCDLEKL